MNHDFKVIISKFAMDTESIPYGEGHINDTYLTQTVPDKYILQRINHMVFKDPARLVDNIALVTDHLQKKIVGRGGDPKRETLTLIKTFDGKNFYKTAEGNYFRMYIFVDGTDTYQTVERAGQFYNAARAFGKFQNDLADFPAGRLHETIPDFHNTKTRFMNLRQAVDEDRAGKKAMVKPEIEFALAREKEASVIVDAIAGGEIPLRVTHNDTKLNNVLFDKKTGEGICVIDLDTVMPGSLLYDFGDSIRFGANTAAEDERDLDKVGCSLELFGAYAEGFLEELKDSVTGKEIELLAFSAKLMTYECGIRFLTDYLNGDTYFKVHRAGHNLDRCRNQFKLVADMEIKLEQMNKTVQAIYSR